MGIYSLGPSYMYSFLDNEYALSSDNPLPGGIFDAKDGLAPKIIFGLNAQVLLYLHVLFQKLPECNGHISNFS